MSNRVVFFTTDTGYLVPTIVAALQVAEQAVGERIADVVVFLIGIAAHEAEMLQVRLPGLKFLHLEPSLFELPIQAHFNPTHVPRSALARLVAARELGANYDHVIYLDGDVQVVGDIRPLLSLNVPEGKLLAAPDVAELVWPEVGDFSSGFRAYVEGLGIRSPSEYFNSGVLASSKETWLQLGSSAFKTMAERSQLCRFHDQSALNIAAYGRRLPLSPRFNFTSALQELLSPAEESVVIIHFTGGEKPWSEAPLPRLARYSDPYVSLVKQHPILQKYWITTAGRAVKDVRHRELRAWREAFQAFRSRRRLIRAKRLLDNENYFLR